METKIIEATNVDVGGMNHGKFMVGRFDNKEWAYQSKVDAGCLLRKRGWAHYHIFVMDLQTGEGAMFDPNGLAKVDLSERHQIWVCPLYERFLTWLYKQDLSDLNKLPDVVQINDPDSALYGYRRSRKETHNVEEKRKPSSRST